MMWQLCINKPLSVEVMTCWSLIHQLVIHLEHLHPLLGWRVLPLLSSPMTRCFKLLLSSKKAWSEHANSRFSFCLSNPHTHHRSRHPYTSCHQSFFLLILFALSGIHCGGSGGKITLIVSFIESSQVLNYFERVGSRDFWRFRWRGEALIIFPWIDAFEWIRWRRRTGRV